MTTNPIYGGPSLPPLPVPLTFERNEMEGDYRSLSPSSQIADQTSIASPRASSQQASSASNAVGLGWMNMLAETALSSPSASIVQLQS